MRGDVVQFCTTLPRFYGVLLGFCSLQPDLADRRHQIIGLPRVDARPISIVPILHNARLTRCAKSGLRLVADAAGASYTDIHVELPVLWLLIGLSIVAAFASWANLRVRTYRLPVAAVVLVFGGSFVLSGVVPALFQRLFVKPDELQREKPYIERNIALTQQAYNLRQITAKPFPAEQDLTFETLEANKATINNIRLWDWQPLIDTYAQLQEIRTYYKFHDVDVDRYWLNGAYQSVMLSARELRSSLLPPNAQTWVNRHVLFTHGNGVVMSPVTRKSTEGLPLFYLRDIPPVATGGPEIREPRIYYG